MNKILAALVATRRRRLRRRRPPSRLPPASQLPRPPSPTRRKRRRKRRRTTPSPRHRPRLLPRSNSAVQPFASRLRSDRSDARASRAFSFNARSGVRRRQPGDGTTRRRRHIPCQTPRGCRQRASHPTGAAPPSAARARNRPQRNGSPASPRGGADAERGLMAAPPTVRQPAATASAPVQHRARHREPAEPDQARRGAVPARHLRVRAQHRRCARPCAAVDPARHATAPQQRDAPSTRTAAWASSAEAGRTMALPCGQGSRSSRPPTLPRRLRCRPLRDRYATRSTPGRRAPARCCSCA